MKPLPLTPKEKKADKLWSKFNRKEQATFWNDYEKLIEQSKPHKVVVPKTSHTASPNVPPPLPTLRKMVFRQSADKFMRASAALLITSLFMVAIFAMTYDSEAGFIMIPFMAIFLSIVVHMVVTNVNNFEVDQHHFSVHRKFMFTRVNFKWQTIQAVHIEQDDSDNGHDLCIRIHTKTKQYKFNYELDNYTHDHLMKVLRQRVPNTIDKRIAA